MTAMTVTANCSVAAYPAPRKAAVAWADALAATATIADNPQRLLADLILSRADTHGSAAALLSDRETLTFTALAARINQYRHWCRSAGFVKGDTVALMMSNRPDYVACWLGLSKEGITVALINTALTDKAVAHAIAVAAPKCIIAEERFVALFDGTVPIAVAGSFAAAMPRTVPSPSAKVGIEDRALLIYTSGTTGLPKAANVSHRRVLNWALWFKGLLGNTEADRIYNCLPLYHSVGGVVAVAATLAAGGSAVIAEKFSARRFWADIRRWDCTQFQYIGELCRYLLAQPPAADDGVHRLRLACGNGLRADIWEAFKTRFALPQIIEFYAATEGTFSLYNVEGVPGSIGRIPPFLRHRFRVALVKHDIETGLPVRGADGLCVAAAAGEPGEALGHVAETSQFEGYTNATETSRKLVRNVLSEGDCWFRTGDLMLIDAAGHYYFVDRIGDTFRWKGENVSTLEVANALSSAKGVTDAVVYGVEVPGADGRAGMAFVDAASDFDPTALAIHAAARLPAFAVPLFLRVGSNAAITETFKHKKADLQRQGFDPGLITDPLFVLLDGSYRRLTNERYGEILAGMVRL
jgi:fatty-acyl-CoA synthase